MAVRKTLKKQSGGSNQNNTIDCYTKYSECRKKNRFTRIIKKCKPILKQCATNQNLSDERTKKVLECGEKYYQYNKKKSDLNSDFNLLHENCYITEFGTPNINNNKKTIIFNTDETNGSSVNPINFSSYAVNHTKPPDPPFRSSRLPPPSNLPQSEDFFNTVASKLRKALNERKLNKLLKEIEDKKLNISNLNNNQQEALRELLLEKDEDDLSANTEEILAILILEKRKTDKDYLNSDYDEDGIIYKPDTFNNNNSILHVGGSRKKKRTLKKGGRPKKQSKKTRKAKK